MYSLGCRALLCLCFKRESWFSVCSKLLSTERCSWNKVSYMFQNCRILGSWIADVRPSAFSFLLCETRTQLFLYNYNVKWFLLAYLHFFSVSVGKAISFLTQKQLDEVVVRAIESSLGNKSRILENVMGMSWAVPVPSWAMAVVAVMVLTRAVPFVCVLILISSTQAETFVWEAFLCPSLTPCRWAASSGPAPLLMDPLWQSQDLCCAVTNILLESEEADGGFPRSLRDLLP